MITITAFHYVLLLRFDLSRVLQHEQIWSFVKKKNAHREHHFCPDEYLLALGIESDFSLVHIPEHVCAMRNQTSDII